MTDRLDPGLGAVHLRDSRRHTRPPARRNAHPLLQLVHLLSLAGNSSARACGVFDIASPFRVRCRHWRCRGRLDRIKPASRRAPACGARLGLRAEPALALGRSMRVRHSRAAGQMIDPRRWRNIALDLAIAGRRSRGRRMPIAIGRHHPRRPDATHLARAATASSAAHRSRNSADRPAPRRPRPAPRPDPCPPHAQMRDRAAVAVAFRADRSLLVVLGNQPASTLRAQSPQAQTLPRYGRRLAALGRVDAEQPDPLDPPSSSVSPSTHTRLPRSVSAATGGASASE